MDLNGSTTVEAANRFADRRDVAAHRHAGLELVHVTAGRCTVRVAAGSWQASGGVGTLFVLPEGRDHDQVNHRPTRTTYLIFAGTPPNLAAPSCIRIPRGGTLARWMEDAVELHSRPQGGSGALNAIGAAIVSELRTTAASDEDGDFHPAVAIAREHLDHHLDRPFDLRALAAHAGISPSRLSALFRRDLGRSPQRYHSQRRMAWAARLLRDPYLPIAEVARTCGFDDANYFARCFRREHGRSPRAWRSAH